ncbi:MAG: hypothetical protein LBB48_04785, partial [Treponema sp.]|nr:hypothetical protein [Treponema sp.]
MDKDAIIEKLQKQKGRPGEVAKAFIAWHNSGWEKRSQTFGDLSAVLMKDSPKTCAEMFDNGPRALFAAVCGAAAADLAGEVAARLHLYVHSPSVYRRSFRTKEVKPYLDRFASVLETLFFSWEDFDMVKDLTAARGDRGDDNRNRLSDAVYGDFLAARIDGGDAELIAAIKEIILGDNNTKLLTNAIINGIIKSADLELYKLLTDLLLAARL